MAVVHGQKVEKTYSRMGETSIIIDHTGVPDALRGAVSVRRWCVAEWKTRAPSVVLPLGRPPLLFLLFENLAIVPFLLLVTLLASPG